MVLLLPSRKIQKVATYGSDSAERRVTKVINESWPVLEGYTHSDVALKMVQARSPEGYIQGAPWQDFITKAGGVVDPMTRQTANSIRDEVKAVSGVRGNITFNAVDDLAVRYAQTQSAKLINDLTESQRAAIRTTFANGLQGEFTLETAARRIRGSIGLHPAWADAVTRFDYKTRSRLMKDGMDPVRAAERSGVLSERYRQKLVRRRAMNIARTEVHISSSIGRLAAIESSVRQGFASPDARKEWSAGPGACPICEELSGEIADWDQPFSNGELISHAHQGCRCTAVQLPPDYGDPMLDPENIDWTGTGNGGYTPLTNFAARSAGKKSTVGIPAGLAPPKTSALLGRTTDAAEIIQATQDLNKLGVVFDAKKSFGDYDEVALNDVVHGLLDVQKKYPWMKAVDEVATTRGSVDDFYGSYSAGTSKMKIHFDLVSAEKAADTYREIQTQTALYAKNRKGIVVHEFGHAMDSFVTDGKPGGFGISWLREFYKKPDLKNNASLGSKLKGDTSDYARKVRKGRVDMAEVVAEAFTDVEMNPGTATALNKFLHQKMLDAAKLKAPVNVIDDLPKPPPIKTPPKLDPEPKPPAPKLPPAEPDYKSAAVKVLDEKLTVDAAYEMGQDVGQVAEGLRRWTMGREGMDAIRTGTTPERWKSGQYWRNQSESAAISRALREALDEAPVRKGTLYRGMDLDDPDDYIMNLPIGSRIEPNFASSFTSSRNVAEAYLGEGADEAAKGVLFKLEDGRGLPVGRRGLSGGEEEWVVGKDFFVHKLEVDPEGYYVVTVKHVAAEIPAHLRDITRAKPAKLSSDELDALAKRVHDPDYTSAKAFKHSQHDALFVETLQTWTEDHYKIRSLTTPEVLGLFDDVLRRSPKYKDLTVYRGMGADDKLFEKFAKMKRGDTIPVKNASSFSEHKFVADRFANQQMQAHKINFVMKDPKGIKLGSRTSYASENELLVGGDLRVVSVKQVGDDLDIEVQHMDDVLPELPKSKLLGEADEAADAKEVASKTRPVSESAQDAIYEYVDQAYRDVNYELRQVGRVVSPHVIDVDRGLRRAIDQQQPLSRPITVYRGLNWDDVKGDSLVDGSIITDRGFASTTFDRQMAAEIFGERAGNGVVLNIRVPANRRVLSTQAAEDALPTPQRILSGEGEVILAPGTKFKMLGKPYMDELTDSSGRTVKFRTVDVEVVEDLPLPKPVVAKPVLKPEPKPAAKPAAAAKEPASDEFRIFDSDEIPLARREPAGTDYFTSNEYVKYMRKYRDGGWELKEAKTAAARKKAIAKATKARQQIDDLHDRLGSGNIKPAYTPATPTGTKPVSSLSKPTSVSAPPSSPSLTRAASGDPEYDKYHKKPSTPVPAAVMEVVKRNVPAPNKNLLMGLKSYTNHGYEDINAALRRGDPDAFDIDVGELDELIAMQKPLTKDITVYRGAPMKGFKKDMTGAVLEDKAYMSTSFKKEISDYFKSAHPAPGEKPVMMKITVPKGKKGILPDQDYVGNGFYSGGEQEFLLPRGSKLKITKDTTKGGVRILEATVV